MGDSPSRADILAAWLAMERKIRSLPLPAPDGAVYAWRESYILHAYCLAMEARLGNQHITQVLRRAMWIDSHCDARMDAFDRQRGRVVWGWGADLVRPDTSISSRFIWPVHDMVIGDALLAAAQATHTALPSLYLTPAMVYEDMEFLWDETQGQYLNDNEGKLIPGPTNQQAAAGRFALRLGIRNRAERLLATVKAALHADGEAMFWPYRPGGRKAEDVIHAAIVADFVCRCAEESVGGDLRPTLKALARTFANTVRPDGSFSALIDGTGQSDAIHCRQMGLWGRLIQFESAVAEPLAAYLMRPEVLATNEPWVFLGLAHLLRWSK